MDNILLKISLKRPVMMLFFFLGISAAYKNGRIIFTTQAALAQYEQIGASWEGAYHMTGQEAMASSSPNPNAVNNYLSSLPPGAPVSQEFYNKHVASSAASGSMDQYSMYQTTAHYEYGVLVSVHVNF